MDKKPHILFIVPPQEFNKGHSRVDRVYGCNYGFDYKPPLHLLLLASTAQQQGYKITFCDCPARGFNKKRFIAFLGSIKPVDIAVFFTVWLSASDDILAAEIISGLFKKAVVLFTGPYPTWKPEVFIKKEHYFVIRGEPEKALVDFLKRHPLPAGHLNEIGNLTFLGPTGLCHNPCLPLLNVEELVIPDRRLLAGTYSFNRLFQHPATVMATSRGCSYKCTFCAPQALDQTIEIECSRNNQDKPPVRLRSAKAVVQEFRQIATLGFKAVEICDNQFVWDKERVFQICAHIRILGLEWICYGRADYLLDPAMLQCMRQAGCRQIYLGTESFCQEILDDTRKGLILGDVYKAVAMVRKAGIEPEISVLLGASGLETEETIASSVKEARKLKTRFVHYSIASPLPHTQLYKTAQENKWLRGNEFIPLDNIRGAQLDLPHIKAERLQAIIKRLYAEQYVSPRFIIGQLCSKGFYKNIRSRIVSFARLLTYLSTSGRRR